MRVIVWGSTGLVGSACLRYLLKESAVTSLVAPTRRPLGISHQKLANPQIDFSNASQLVDVSADADAGIGVLGTTLRQAGSRDAFRAIDLELSLKVAEAGRMAGIARWSQVSAVGAARDSMFFYSRVKGELEASLEQLEFPALDIFRPGLLVGQRQQFRLGESLAIKGSGLMNLFMVGPLELYRAIPSDTVGRALAHNAVRPVMARATTIYHHADMLRLATQPTT